MNKGVFRYLMGKHHLSASVMKSRIMLPDIVRRHPWDWDSGGGGGGGELHGEGLFQEGAIFC
jgi:hypothetical protein